VPAVVLRGNISNAVELEDASTRLKLEMMRSIDRRKTF
jgi:hypothetical protein